MQTSLRQVPCTLEKQWPQARFNESEVVSLSAKQNMPTRSALIHKVSTSRCNNAVLMHLEGTKYIENYTNSNHRQLQKFHKM